MKTLAALTFALLFTTSANAMDIDISINGTTFSAEIDDTPTGRAFCDLLPMTLDMSELNGNEKYHYLMSGLPTDAHYCSSISAGDLMLFGNACVVLFYGSAGGYSYTRLGRLSSTDGLREAVGQGSVSVTFSRSTTSNAPSTVSARVADNLCDLQGRHLDCEPAQGVYLKNGKKVVKP